MKRIVDGVEYNTDTSRQVAYWAEDHQASDAAAALYQSEQGVFFMQEQNVAGEPLPLQPVSRAAAQLFVEQNNPAEYVRLFGHPTQPRAPRYSRRTVFEAIDYLQGEWNKAQIKQLLLNLGPEIYQATNLTGTAAQMIEGLKITIDRQSGKMIDGQPIEDVIVENAISAFYQAHKGFSHFGGMEEEWDSMVPAFSYSLANDGFRLTPRGMRRQFPLHAGMSDHESLLEALLSKYSMDDPKNRLGQAMENYRSGNWESVNAQLRAFSEGVFKEIVNKLDRSESSIDKENTLRALSMVGFLKPYEDSKDVKGDPMAFHHQGQTFIQHFYRLLHSNGSHAGKTDRTECDFRLHITLSAILFYLKRFDELVER